MPGVYWLLGEEKKKITVSVPVLFSERVLATAGSKVPVAPAGDAEKPFFTLFHHPLPMSPRTNHFSDVASVRLATVHPNYHFCWDGMSHSVEILVFSLTTDSTQRMSLDEKNNFEAAAVR